MMSRGIELDINAYGIKARVEALADWLEFAAMAGRRVMGAQLGDLISDNGWTKLSPRQTRLPDGTVGDETPEFWVDAVHNTLVKRAAILGDRWPFFLDGAWAVKVRPGVELVTPYTALLALTVAHAWNISTPVDPTVILEETAVRALRNLGLSAVQVGTADPVKGGFPARLKRAADALNLPSVSGAAVQAIAAKEEGVDALAMIGWPNDKRRAGQWIFVGQVTIARSTEWYTKMMEPRPELWRERLAQPLDPLRFLVVPHHVSADYLHTLVTSGTGVVIDRLRLALVLEDVSIHEAEVLQAVLASGVDDGRAAA